MRGPGCGARPRCGGVAATPAESGSAWSALETSVSWEEMGVPDEVGCAVRRLGYERPTVVQSAAVPAGLRGEDCLIEAETGSGKTLAYLVPLFAKVSASRQAAQAAVIVPSRELGLQVAAVARGVARGLPESEGRRVRVMSLLDGSKLRRQRAWAWAEPPQVIVANARPVFEMATKGGLRCADLAYVAVDEVDVFFEPGRAAERAALAGFLATAPARQTVFATASLEQPRHFVAKLASTRWAATEPTYVSLKERRLPSRLDHFSTRLDEPEKRLALALSVLRRFPGLPAVVFCAETRPLAALAAALARKLPRSTLALLDPAADLDARAAAVAMLRDGRADVLIATDLAARGLDIPRLRLVLNFDFPPDAHAYQHRAGRAARAGNPGLAVTILLDNERFALRRFANFLHLPDLRDLAAADPNDYAPPPLEADS